MLTLWHDPLRVWIPSSKYDLKHWNSGRFNGWLPTVVKICYIYLSKTEPHIPSSTHAYHIIYSARTHTDTLSLSLYIIMNTHTHTYIYIYIYIYTHIYIHIYTYIYIYIYIYIHIYIMMHKQCLQSTHIVVAFSITEEPPSTTATRPVVRPTSGARTVKREPLPRPAQPAAVAVESSWGASGWTALFVHRMMQNRCCNSYVLCTKVTVSCGYLWLIWSKSLSGC